MNRYYNLECKKGFSTPMKGKQPKGLKMKDQGRREFILNSARIGTAAIVTGILGNELLFPQTGEAANLKFPDSTCGSKNKGSKKILIAYASEFGTTGEVAAAIGDVLCKEGNTVETKWVKNVKELNSYDAVIVGSPIHKGKWMSEAKEFVKANQKQLQQLPVVYFYTCLFLHKQNPKSDIEAKEVAENLHAMVPQVKPLRIGGFAGVLDYRNMGFFHSLILKLILSNKGVKEGDYRDWKAIKRWAKETLLKVKFAGADRGNVS